jgi:hypothetical protein
LHKEELHNLYSPPNIIRQMKSRRMRWVEHVTRMEQERKVYKVLVRKPEGKRPLTRPSLKWKCGIRMNLREIGWGSVEKVQLVPGYGPEAGSCECGDEPAGSGATTLVIEYKP